jgi:hypothetical protein
MKAIIKFYRILQVFFHNVTGKIFTIKIKGIDY